MKKITYLIALLVVVLLAAAGGWFFYVQQTDGKSTQEVVRSIEQLVKKETVANLDRSKVLIVGVDRAFPPMTFENTSGKITGFDVDLANAVGEVINKEIVIFPLEWSKKDDDLNSGRIDVIWSGMSVTDARKKLYDFTRPYLNNKQMVMVTVDSFIESEKDLTGAVVGMQKGAITADVVRKYKGSDGGQVGEVKDVYSEVPIALSGMLMGEVDAVVLEETSARYYNKYSPGTFRLIEGFDMGAFDTAIITKKGNSKLREELNDALATLESNGKLKSIRKKWFGVSQ